MNKRLLAAGFLMASLGCGISKKHASKSPKAGSTPVVTYDTAMRQPGATLPNPSGPALPPGVAQRLLAQPAFQTFSGKAKAEFETGGDRKEFSLVVRIQSGKAIWISANALGGLVNVGRALITPDSVQAINYLQREAYRMPYSAAGRFLPIDVPFETLQALLTGGPLFSGADGLSMIDSPAVLTVVRQQAGTVQTLTFRKSDSLLRQATFNSTTGAAPIALQLAYDDYVLRNGRQFPKDRTAHIVSKGKESTLQLRFDDPTWDAPVEMPFSIPSKYTIK